MLKAIKFAVIKHQGQVRKVSGEPYVTHPIGVAELVLKYKQSKHINALVDAAILHDCLEDTDATFVEIATEFSPLVASLVLEMTSDPEMIKKMGKLEYLKKRLVGMSSYALVDKLCDRLYNINDNPTPKMIADTKELMVFLKDNRKLSETHLAIIQDIESSL